MTWNELIRIMGHYGFSEHKGKGSGRKFVHKDGRVLVLHEPHPQKILKPYQIKAALKIIER